MLKTQLELEVETHFIKTNLPGIMTQLKRYCDNTENAEEFTRYGLNANIDQDFNSKFSRT
jgi:hypothetical protein